MESKYSFIKSFPKPLSKEEEKEYEIISLRFGFDNNEPHTLDELSKKYNFSRQYANVTIKKY